ncbi:MAG: LPS-assembly protein LptD [Treponema sp.]|nr:LPS-assembly protein LptD [Treponema sp.]
MLYAQEAPASEENNGGVADFIQEDPAPEESLSEKQEETQETSAAPAAPAVPAEMTPEQRRIDREITTSTLPELAAWCRSLGLSEGGTSADLAKRLRGYFEIREQGTESGDDKRKIITVESARSTEYFKIEAVNEEYARLIGDVQVSLKDGDAIHRIKAWEILFNRSRNIITASGEVEYIKESGDTIETFRGDSITVNIDDWSSIFLGGVSERSLQNNDTTYLFAGTVITRNDEEVTILNKATISNAKDPESLWSLDASRVWLLPGSDFAVLNALLKVGEIPVLYIPFFYYPADEMILHPVLGFRSREGTFAQTTSYILGRPRASSSSQSSLTKILGNSNDMEKKREGLFLRSTGKKVVDKNETTLKAMVDYYSNLGGYLGMDMTMPKKGIWGATSLSLGLGFSRTIMPVGNGYTPFDPAHEELSDWNRSNFLSLDVPFRYRLTMNSSVSGKYGGLSWNIPYYSDPWVDRDFLNRTEEMDWVNMIQQGAAFEEDTATSNQVGTYSWQLTGNLNPKYPDMRPYISSISLSNITSTVSFRQKTQSLMPAGIQQYSPSRDFFFPDTWTLYSVNGSISGTPLKIGSDGTSNQSNANTEESEPADLFKNIGVPRSPWETEEAETEQNTGTTDPLSPPALTQRFDILKNGTTNFTVDYLFAPASATELKFNSTPWGGYNDIDWSDVQSVLSIFRGEANTSLKLGHTEGLYSSTFTFSGNGSWRQYGYLNEEAADYLDVNGDPDPQKINDIYRQQYSQSFFATSYNYTASFRPLYHNAIFSQSSLEYSLRGLAVRSNFVTMNEDKPEWEMEYGEWTKEKIDSHQLSTKISASIMDKIQTFTLASELPPRDPAITSDATFRIWITETNARMRILFPHEDEDQSLGPFYLTETFRFGTFGSLTHYMVWEWGNGNKVRVGDEERDRKDGFSSITTTLNLSQWGLAAVFAATYMQGYEFKPDGTGSGSWEAASGEPSIKPRDLTLTYKKTFAQKELWDKRLDFSVNIDSRLFLDLQRCTSSSFSLSLGFTLGISKFLDLSLSTRSENANIYWYFKDLPMFSHLPAELRDGDYNMFTDLFNSFRFDDDSLRRQSSFKMKNFNLTATHHMGDWNAKLGITMSPYRKGNTYEMNNEVSFLIQWIPIGELKSDIAYSKQYDRWTIK